MKTSDLSEVGCITRVLLCMYDFGSRILPSSVSILDIWPPWAPESRTLTGLPSKQSPRLKKSSLPWSIRLWRLSSWCICQSFPSEGYIARIHPGASAEDCPFAEVGVNPTHLLPRSQPLLTDSHFIILQVRYVGLIVSLPDAMLHQMPGGSVLRTCGARDSRLPLLTMP